MSSRMLTNSAGRCRKIPFLFLVLVILGPILLASDQNLLVPESRTITRSEVGPGCNLYQVRDRDRVLAFFVLRVDLANPHIQLESVLSQDFGRERKTVPELCRLFKKPYFRVIGGINTDFFAGNQPVGIVLRDGELIKRGRGWSALAIAKDKNPTIGIFENAGTQELNRFQDIVGGGPRIVRAGKVSVEREREGQREGFDDEAHPRTAAGFTQDRRYLVLVVVDGRQPGHSLGVDLYELAEIMLAFGCYEALNLDGGGSSTMVIRNRVVNSPSDPFGARPVAAALLVICTAPLG